LKDEVKLIEIANATIFRAVVIGAIAFTIAGAVIGIGLPALAVGIAAMGGVGTALIGGSSLELVIRIVNLIKNSKAKKSKINRPFRYKLLKLTGFFFSTKIQIETFEQNMADWD
jgi:hypothetical protein